MSDLISRQAAIDAMLKLQAEDDEAYGCHILEGFDGERAREALELLPSAQPEGRKGVFIPDITVEMFRNASLESVEELMVSGEMKDIVSPPAQPERYKWNPIKDGLPDEEGVYFVTDDAGGMATVYIDVFSHYEDSSPYWLYSQNVTAWMHTPEPYKEDKDA